jgi:hypothetical protein
MLRQQSAICRTFGMEGGRRLTVAQMDCSHRGQIVGLNQVAGLDT